MKDKIKECETALSVIPSSLTWRLQPIDTNISKMFKKQVCRHLNWQKQYNRIKECNHRTYWCVMGFRFYYNLWNGFDTFKYSRISHSLDGNEDDQFREYKDIEKGNEIFQI